MEVAGLYKARFRVGQKQLDQLIEVHPEAGSLEIDGTPVDFSSPVPLAGNGTDQKVHQKAAEKFSESAGEKKGQGSWLFLFLRAKDDFAFAPWVGVSLHDLDGTLLADPSIGTCDREKGFYALHLEVDPGTYRLRVEEEPGEFYEIFLRTVAGWQTQVFAFSEEAWLPDVEAYRAALPSASVLMAEAGQGFDPGNEVTRQVELLRLGLLNGRKVVTEAVVESLLREESLNPMQVIFVAHSLLGQGNLDNALLHALLRKLPGVFREHPDLQPLMLEQQNEMRPAYPAPPILRTSWDCILRAVEQRKAIAPPGSLTTEIAGGVLSTSLWLVHHLGNLEV
ncbi:MAG: hypothetical protein D3909_06600 [Candidatus Electrothrix sp. ATG1]|nr:hypothetical protein [Candidatus Electrothrix sp. ATG1]